MGTWSAPPQIFLNMAPNKSIFRLWGGQNFFFDFFNFLDVSDYSKQLSFFLKKKISKEAGNSYSCGLL